ncbi:hypothetical protein AKJ16_DCAP12901 [Drosera capensis]
MAFRDNFEPAQASLLHHHPMSTLRSALSKLISEETRFHIHRLKSTDGVLMSASSKPQHTCGTCPQELSLKPCINLKVVCQMLHQWFNTSLHCPSWRVRTVDGLLALRVP